MEVVSGDDGYMTVVRGWVVMFLVLSGDWVRRRWGGIRSGEKIGERGRRRGKMNFFVGWLGPIEK